MSNFDCDEESDGVVNTAALGIVELAKNASFRTIVHNKIRKDLGTQPKSIKNCFSE